jgi:hypothetical protein
MERHNAFALAAAVSMTLVSATAALGANIGALGFAGPSAAPPAVVAPAAAPQPVAPTPVADQTVVAKPRSGEHEGRARTQPVAPTSAPKGERDD